MLIASQADAFQLANDISHYPGAIKSIEINMSSHRQVSLACSKTSIHHHRSRIPHPVTAQEVSYATKFAGMTRLHVEALVNQAKEDARQMAAFSMSCYSHSTSETDDFVTVTVDGATAAGECTLMTHES